MGSLAQCKEIKREAGLLIDTLRYTDRWSIGKWLVGVIAAMWR
jgi:hypothetical protein